MMESAFVISKAANTFRKKSPRSKFWTYSKIHTVYPSTEYPAVTIPSLLGDIRQY